MRGGVPGENQWACLYSGQGFRGAGVGEDGLRSLLAVEEVDVEERGEVDEGHAPLPHDLALHLPLQVLLKAEGEAQRGRHRGGGTEGEAQRGSQAEVCQGYTLRCRTISRCWCS